MAGWLRQWWRWSGRLATAAVALAGAVPTWFLADYHLIAGPLGALPG
ncbi:hypothetical protein [Kitasatospora fiedleri]|nr:hypothetical protein [Kitasatospora fiedleri]